MIIPLCSLQATSDFALALARAIASRNPGALLLYGGLGAGKTTLTRLLVEALPGGRDAEVASPSFTICNIYCTAPLVHHFDLYRLESGCADEALEESLDDASVLTIVEWPERLADRALPEDGLVCRLTACGDQERRIELTALGSAGAGSLSHVASLYPQQRG